MANDVTGIVLMQSVWQTSQAALSSSPSYSGGGTITQRELDVRKEMARDEAKRNAEYMKLWSSVSKEQVSMSPHARAEAARDAHGEAKAQLRQQVGHLAGGR